MLGFGGGMKHSDKSGIAFAGWYITIAETLSDTMTENTAAEPSAAPQYVVRHGAMRFLGAFDDPGQLGLQRLDRVVVKTDRGQETGDVLCPASPQALAYLPEPTHGQVVRRMTPEDLQREEQFRQLRHKEFDRGR